MVKELQNEPPSFGEGCITMGVVAILVALPISIFMGDMAFYPLVAIVTVAIVGTIGSVVFVVIRKAPTWPKVVAGGFFTGAIFPALFMQPNSTLVENVSVVGGFGTAGVAGALLVWALMPGPRQTTPVVSSTAKTDRPSRVSMVVHTPAIRAQPSDPPSIPKACATRPSRKTPAT